MVCFCDLFPRRRYHIRPCDRINSLANLDKRLLEVVRSLREGTWSYIRGSSTKRDLAASLAEQLGRPPSWGDPTVIPAYGGNFADEAWKQLGVGGRCGIGGMPCELLHGGIGESIGLQNDCIANAAIRAVYAFAQALVLNLPVSLRRAHSFGFIAQPGL
jgi:hypothetical protein